jgi:hypothetical protein
MVFVRIDAMAARVVRWIVVVWMRVGWEKAEEGKRI